MAKNRKLKARLAASTELRASTTRSGRKFASTPTASDLAMFPPSLVDPAVNSAIHSQTAVDAPSVIHVGNVLDPTDHGVDIFLGSGFPVEKNDVLENTIDIVSGNDLVKSMFVGNTVKLVSADYVLLSGNISVNDNNSKMNATYTNQFISSVSSPVASGKDDACLGNNQKNPLCWASLFSSKPRNAGVYFPALLN